MSKRKPATASKRAVNTRKPATRASRRKVASRAHRAKQALVRSPRERRRPDATGSPDNSSVENRVSKPRKGFDFSSLPSNTQAYQAALLDVAKANVQFAVEFAQRLTTIRSPLEFLAVTAEYTGRRILMIGTHSKEMTAVLMRR
jgi:hypothetical protein